MENMTTEKSNGKAGRVLVLDDEIGMMEPLCKLLIEEGYEAVGFCKSAEALESLKKQEFDLLITDLMMPGVSGIDILRAGLEIDPNLVCIVMTGYGTIQTAVEAMKTGAFDYIQKPFRLKNLLPILSRAMQMRSLRTENMQLRETVAIHELGKAIAFSSDLDSIMNRVADAALLQCLADEVSIMLPTADGKALYVAIVRGNGSTEKIGVQIPLEQGIAGWVARNLEPLVLRGEVNDPRVTPFMPRSDIQTSVSMPMMSSGKLVGVLNVNITKNHRHFTLGQLNVLGILVSIISPILERTQLYIQLREGEKKYRSIFENILDGIYQRLPDGKIISANPALARVFGYDSPQDLMTNITDICLQIYINPDDYAKFSRIMESHGEVRDFEYPVYRKDKTKAWVSENARAVRDENGVLLYYEGILSDISKRKQAEERLIQNVEDTVRAMAMIVENRDMYTAGHQERTTSLAVAIAKEMQLTEVQIKGLRMAGIIHDIGKLNVPSEILTKPSQLNNIEFELVKMHAVAGYKILETIDFPYPVAQIVYQHHERINGSGYPQGLKEENTLLESRILAVADVVEAIASHRPYRPALGIDIALDEISEKKGILYDTAAVDACLKLFNEERFKL
ncbi:MAG: response regulator [Proteobacteria bacterium]|nr:response regulator [Pseudomonadota bacterium]